MSTVMTVEQISERSLEVVEGLDFSGARRVSSQLERRLHRSEHIPPPEYQVALHESLQGLIDGGDIVDGAVTLSRAAAAHAAGFLSREGVWTAAERRLTVVTLGCTPIIRVAHRRVGEVRPERAAELSLHLVRRWKDHCGYGGMADHMREGDAPGRALKSLLAIAAPVTKEAAALDPQFEVTASIACRLLVVGALADSREAYPRSHAVNTQAFGIASASRRERILAGETPWHSQDQIERLEQHAAASYPDTPRGNATRSSHDVTAAVSRGETERVEQLEAREEQHLREAGLTDALRRRQLRAEL